MISGGGDTAFFQAVPGLWSAATIVVLIYAIRLCYQIEKRSGWRKPGSVPTYAAWIPVIFNWGVARDDETQALRRKMNLLFLAVLVSMILFGTYVMLFLP